MHLHWLVAPLCSLLSSAYQEVATAVYRATEDVAISDLPSALPVLFPFDQVHERRASRSQGCQPGSRSQGRIQARCEEVASSLVSCRQLGELAQEPQEQGLIAPCSIVHAREVVKSLFGTLDLRSAWRLLTRHPRAFIRSRLIGFSIPHFPILLPIECPEYEHGLCKQITTESNITFTFLA